VKKPLILAAAALLGVQAHAREVAIEDFSHFGQMGGDLTEPRSAELQLKPYPKVATAMFMHFSRASQPVSATPVGGTLADRLGPQSTPELGNSGFVSSVQFDISDRQFAACDSTTYSPTWWLSREAEARRARYFTTMASIACEHGLSTSLLDAVISQESGYRSWAISSAGAMGMMQIMPGTAQVLGLALPFDPIANMRAGARYLRQQLDRFGRVDLALAAYNAGPERRSLARGYVPAIPETINYVRTITTNWARLAALSQPNSDAMVRATAATVAVRTSGYRDVNLTVYEGMNSANPI
jgi:soluble lytic murein transglycosylase-like protein